MKCWNSTFNAQVNIVVIHVGVVEIQYGAIMEALRKKTRQNLIYHKNWWFLKFHPWLNANFFLVIFFLISPCLWPNLGFWCCVFFILWITLLYTFNDRTFLQIHINWLWVNVLMVFFFNGPFGWPITKNIMKSATLLEKIKFFTLFYMAM